MATKKGNKLPLTIFEIVWYSLCTLVALWGITYIVLGLVANYANIPNSDNAIRTASESYAKTFGMGFFGYGLVHLGVALVLALIVLLINSKKADRDYEKEVRRAAIRASARAGLTVEEVETITEEIHEEVREENETTLVPEEETPVEE